MKITLFALLILCSAAAFGQQAAPSVSAQPQPAIFVDHPLHAGPHAMASEQPIAGTNSESYSYAQGERPLWEFGPISQPIPLGDVARAYRNQKSTAKKAQTVLDKQGS
jgi:hypothetical protein